MTRDEAINTLGNFKRYISGGGVVDLKANEAIDMAIEALSAKQSGDLIRRVDVIEAVASANETDGTVKVFTGRQVNGILSALPSAEAEQKWIPVSEGLPEPPSFCLVTTDGSHNDVIDIALYMSDGWHKASEIVAWMPLPEPYKGGDNE